ncbi:malate:quinone oxidoreductase, partial [Staphylococcus capitis]|uniref:malate:quinone oxidoreductase n=1 Tax=Staphylococcus capitis TaxID=29388 RepID=UPI003703D95B
MDIEKGKEMNEEFEICKELWGDVVKSGKIDKGREFINGVGEISLVRGKNKVKLLKDG